MRFSKLHRSKKRPELTEPSVSKTTLASWLFTVILNLETPQDDRTTDALPVRPSYNVRESYMQPVECSRSTETFTDIHCNAMFTSEFTHVVNDGQTDIRCHVISLGKRGMCRRTGEACPGSQVNIINLPVNASQKVGHYPYNEKYKQIIIVINILRKFIKTVAIICHILKRKLHQNSISDGVPHQSSLWENTVFFLDPKLHLRAYF